MQLKIYTAPACRWCKNLKEWIKRRRISFEEVDIDENEKEREKMIEKSGQMAVPVIEAGGEIIVGFDEKRLEEAIRKGKS